MGKIERSVENGTARGRLEIGGVPSHVVNLVRSPDGARVRVEDGRVGSSTGHESRHPGDTRRGESRSAEAENDSGNSEEFHVEDDGAVNKKAKFSKSMRYGL